MMISHCFYILLVFGVALALTTCEEGLSGVRRWGDPVCGGLYEDIGLENVGVATPVGAHGIGAIGYSGLGKP